MRLIEMAYRRILVPSGTELKIGQEKTGSRALAATRFGSEGLTVRICRLNPCGDQLTGPHFPPYPEPGDAKSFPVQ